MAVKRILHKIILLAILVSGCSTPSAVWHQNAGEIVRGARSEGAPGLLPSEYASLAGTFAKGEELLLQEKVEEADLLFNLTILKGQLLRKNLAAEKTRIAEVERLTQLELQQLEDERMKAVELEKESRRRQAEEVKARVAEQARLNAEAEARRQAERLKLQKERQLVSSHTVKRGESLPQIAALPEIYSDPLLWPLVYRANRDQIRDPRNLWPGQKLRIPRNYSREDIQEARRYAQDKRL